MDLCMNGRAHARSYRDFIIALRDVGAPSVTHAQAFALPKNSEYLAIRHDVDHRLDLALKMARIEREEGIRSTYYLLPPGDYNSPRNYYGSIVDGQIYASAELAEGALELQALGHEVGLHNDFLQLSTLLRRPVAQLIREEVAYFASIGVAVTGSASHGSAFARKHGFTNYEIFVETKERRLARSIDLGEHGSFELFSIPMAEAGLSYEAYWVPRQVYISDTGSVLTAGYHRTQEASLSWIRDNIGSARKIAALIHADWWTEVQPQRDLETLLAERAARAQEAAAAAAAAAEAAAAAAAAASKASDAAPEPTPAAVADSAPAVAATVSSALEHVASGLLPTAANAPASAPDAASASTPEPAAPAATEGAVAQGVQAAGEPGPGAAPVAATVQPPENPHRATLGDYGGFLAMLHARGDVRFMTYDDLLWEDDSDHVNSFPEEWERWRQRVRGDKDMQKKVHVLIQHDTDSGPAETLAMARLEADFGVRSSIMTFARRPLRVGEPAIEDYRIDWDGLHSLVHQGFVVGYHCNALHLTCFDEDGAPHAFTEDLVALKHRGFKIDYFTAHGGPSSPTGLGNSAIDYPGLTGSPVRWVNTRFSPRFDGYFSDGGKGSNRSGVERFSDLREFVASMRPGGRYRILVHSQYFEPTDMHSAMCLLPPWPERPAASAQATAAGDFAVTVRSDRPSSSRLYDAARERARRVFGGTRAWRLLSHLVNAPGRVRRLEASVAARKKEADSLKAQIDALRDKNQALYHRTVEYADRIQKLNATAAKKAAAAAAQAKKADTGR